MSQFSDVCNNSQLRHFSQTLLAMCYFLAFSELPHCVNITDNICVVLYSSQTTIKPIIF